MSKAYKYKGEEFVVTKPEACVMGNQEYTALVRYIQTNQFRGALDGSGSDHNTLPAELDAACHLPHFGQV